MPWGQKSAEQMAQWMGHCWADWTVAHSVEHLVTQKVDLWAAGKAEQTAQRKVGRKDVQLAVWKACLWAALMADQKAEN